MPHIQALPGLDESTKFLPGLGLIAVDVVVGYQHLADLETLVSLLLLLLSVNLHSWHLCWECPGAVLGVAGNLGGIPSILDSPSPSSLQVSLWSNPWDRREGSGVL